MNFSRPICILLLAGALFFSGAECSADLLTQKSDADYERTSELLRNHQYADALAAFARLAQAKNDNVYYQYGRIAALIELAKEEKERKSGAWKRKGKEAAVMIKKLYQKHMNDPEFYLVSARYYTLIEREWDVDLVVKKALYYRADYSEANIVKGDAYFWLTRILNPAEEQEKKSYTSSSPHLYAKHEKAMKAKECYDAAMQNTTLAGPRRAYVYFMLAELEQKFFLNREKAAGYRKKAADAAPESYWGRKAAEIVRSGRD